MEDMQESITPFTLREAIKRLCTRSRRQVEPIEEECLYYLDHPVSKLYKESLPFFYRLSIKTGQRYMMIGKSQKMGNRKKHDYMYDYRYNEDEDYIERLPPVYFIIDLDNGALLLETTDSSLVPTLDYWREKRGGIRASLWDILQLHELCGTPEPQTPAELKDVLVKYGFDKQTVVASYCGNFNKMAMYPMVNIFPKNPEYDTKLSFWAYPISSTVTGYAFHQPPKHPDPSIMMFETIPESEIPAPKPDILNRKIAVNVQLTGLTLANKLGVIDDFEMEQLSQEISNCVGGLWITFDDEKHPRHVSFSGGSNNAAIKHQHTVQLDSCEGENVKQWTKILKQIQACGVQASKEKAKILQSVFDRLEPFHKLNKRDLWCKCHNQLKSVVRKYKVFVYGFDDTTLHAIKVPIAGVFKTKKSHGVNMYILANNTIAGLSTTDIDFLNLNEYINYDGRAFDPWQDDVNLWKVANDWFPITGEDSLTPWFSPRLRHDKKVIKNYPKMFGDTPMYQYLNDRGIRNADAIRQLWSCFCHFVVKHFSYDLATRGHTSISKFSFDIVWLQYANLAGPLGHSFEILHPYTEHLIRPWCTGGFSYSANTYLSEGQNIHDDPNQKQEAASSIRELDLTSAYGFSGMNMSAPKGFGINFGHGMKTQRRYNLFEFKAVYYTLFKWSQTRKIKSVFSNFSHLGLVYVGKYPIDLVAIFDDGTIELVQIDGHYCHGDYLRDCHTLERYADGKSRSDCEEKTKARDEFILNWMMQVNQDKMTYTVYTDCCHPEYHPRALKYFFRVYKQLSDLVSGLDQVDGTLECVSEEDDENITFYAIVEGYAQKNHDHFFGPVFYVDKDTGERSTTNDGTMLITTDYYRYLVKQFDFKVTNIQWISYYKRCHTMPQIFTKMVLLRQNFPKDSSCAGFLKSVVNYACGYFGLHRSKHPFMKARIAYQLPRNFNVFRHEATALPYFDEIDLYVVKTMSESSHLKNKSTTPLLHFVSIIEYGKMQLNRAIQIFQRHLRPTAFKILYSNVDNLIFACSSDTLEDALKDTSNGGKQNFHKEWLPLFGTSPGCFKEEWKLESGHAWKFVTPFCMFYSLTTDDKSQCRSKTSCFKGIVPEEIFNIALNVWKKERVKVDIEKIKNKLVSTETHTVTYRM